VRLAQRLAHRAAEHLREPERGGGEDAEQRGSGHDQVEVRGHEHRVVQVDVRPAWASHTPDRPPLMKSEMTPIAQSMGVVNRIRAR
jgi:hypothetical protein